MKATGIVRRIDELGRVVIPKEIRRTQRIRQGDALEIFTAAQALEFRRPARSSELLEAVVADFRKMVPKIEEDEEMYKHIHKAEEFIANVEL